MDLKNLFHQGFLAAPHETQEEFQTRIRTLLDLQSDPSSLFAKFPRPIANWQIDTYITFQSAKKLPPWIGAMTWICDYTPTAKIPLIQLPSKKPLPWISLDECLAHEKIHALRSSFHEPIFEELLAYRTSPTPWRRFLGPLFRAPIESNILMTLFILSLIITPVLPFLYLSFLLIRLTRCQYLLKKAACHLAKSYPNPEQIIVCLTDKEIHLFAKNQSDKIPKDSLRWQQILSL